MEWLAYLSALASVLIGAAALSARTKAGRFLGLALILFGMGLFFVASAKDRGRSYDPDPWEDSRYARGER